MMNKVAKCSFDYTRNAAHWPDLRWRHIVLYVLCATWHQHQYTDFFLKLAALCQCQADCCEQTCLNTGAGGSGKNHCVLTETAEVKPKAAWTHLFIYLIIYIHTADIFTWNILFYNVARKHNECPSFVWPGVILLVLFAMSLTSFSQNPEKNRSFLFTDGQDETFTELERAHYTFHLCA